MRTSTTDIETGLVDLSRWGLQEAMALRDPLVAEAQHALLEHLTEDAVGQVVGGGGENPYFSARRHNGTSPQEPRHEHGPPAPSESASPCDLPDDPDRPALPC
ncbi:hypothetical protein [Streptomyces sp. NPDC055140]